ncbi:DUF2272 domain-containing protein [Caballeronia sp. 15711]|uniref:DUF2272 domain-containing protein n=1 Tax=Caballeronia sp. 15711 TaxID=3391029 RepID=UPI0039E2EB19
MVSKFHTRVAEAALAEFEQFHTRKEWDKELTARIKQYWADVGLTFERVEKPWSAVFVSFCVKKAGATKEDFSFSARHSRFVHDAIANAISGTGVTRGYEAHSYAPQVGDIIQNNRDGNAFTFKNATEQSRYESHSAIVVILLDEGGKKYAVTVGGNESNSVGRAKVELTPEGFIKDKSDHYIAIVHIDLTD